MLIRRILIVCVMFAGCRAGSLECGPTNQFDQCASACLPRRMRSFKDGQGGCAQTECVCDDAKADGGAP